jgi:hypothetical protein
LNDTIVLLKQSQASEKQLKKELVSAENKVTELSNLFNMSQERQVLLTSQLQDALKLESEQRVQCDVAVKTLNETILKLQTTNEKLEERQYNMMNNQFQLHMNLSVVEHKLKLTERNETECRQMLFKGIY